MVLTVVVLVVPERINICLRIKKILIELICNEQIRMIIKHPQLRSSNKYKLLEELKVKIKK